MILLSIILIVLCKRQYKKYGVTTSMLVLSLYTLSACLSVAYRYIFPEDAYKFSFLSEIYYIVCLLIFLFPILRFSINANILDFESKLLNIISFIVAFGGIVVIVSNILKFDMGRLAYSWAEQRNEYYSNMYDYSIASSWYDRIASNCRHITFLAIPLFFYYSIKQNRIMSILLGIASFSLASMAIINASRQELVIFLVLIIFSSILFYKEMSGPTKHKLMLVTIVLISTSVVLVSAISISRFMNGSSLDFIKSLFAYSGEQPFNASLFLEDLHDKALWGRVNFPYLLGESQITQLNDVISASYYLNVFGSIVGSFYLDFGYYSVFFALLFSGLFCYLLNFAKNKSAVLYFYVYMIYNIFIIYGVFYFQQNSSECIRIMTFMFFLILFLSKKNSYERRI